MAIIKAPNKDYCGVCATVPFASGKGETENKQLIEWFKTHGYVVEDQQDQQEDKPHESEETQEPISTVEEPIASSKILLDEMSIEELKIYAAQEGIYLGNSTSENGIIKKIKEAKGL